MNNKVFKGLVSIALTISFLSCSNNNYIEMKDINIDSYDDGCCISYCLGNVFIGDKEFLSNIDKTNYWDIYVEDLRNSKKDPDVIVRDSFKINNLSIQKEIIDILCEYERCYPSNWNRSYDSMLLEWVVHNYFYYFLVLQERTGNVDFNNGDENIYNNKVLQKIFIL